MGAAIVNDTDYTWTFEFDTREHQRGDLAIMRHERWSLWRQLAGGAVGACALMTLVMAVVNPTMRATALLIAVMSAFWVSILLLRGVLSAYQFKKLNPPGHREIMIGLNVDGFRTATFVGRVNINWPAIKRVVETSAFFLFYVTGTAAYYVPKRVIPANQLPGVRELVRERVAPPHVTLTDRT